MINRTNGIYHRVRVTWSDVFNDGPQCSDVDFLIMIQPKEDPSTYTLSDFTRKGQRTATLRLLDPTADYIFQVHTNSAAETHCCL